MESAQSCIPEPHLRKINSSNSAPALLISPNKMSATSTAAAPKAVCERKWKSKNGERLRDTDGYRLRAAGICARRNGRGEAELLLVSAQSETTWVIPGGGIELGEQMHEAVLREVEEEAGVQAAILESLGEFRDDNRLHRTALYLLAPVVELEEWEDGRTGRRRCWLTCAEAIRAVKPTQRSMLEMTAQRIAEIEKTAISAR